MTNDTVVCVHGDYSSSGCYCDWGWVGSICDVSWSTHEATLSTCRYINIICYLTTALFTLWRLVMITRFRRDRRALRRAHAVGDRVSGHGHGGDGHGSPDHAALLQRHKSRMTITVENATWRQRMEYLCRWYTYTDTQWWTMVVGIIACAFNAAYFIDPLLTQGVYTLTAMTICSVIGMSSSMVCHCFPFIVACFILTGMRVCLWLR
jgi:hypothetical protein